MADLEMIKQETQRAYAEAGIDDADLSFLTQELVDEVEASAQSVDELDETGPDGEPRPEWGNLLWNVWFAGGPGSNVYGYLLSGGTCGGSWSISYKWSTRRIERKCSNRNSYIWRVA